MKNLFRHNPVIVAFSWIAVYLLIIILPLLVLLIYPSTPDRGFWTEFSVAVGFIALAMMALQFVLTARIGRIESSYGADILLGFHRYTSLVAFALVLLHPVILWIVQPQTLQLLDFPNAPWRARLAVLSTLSFILLVVTTLARKSLKIPYEPWRFSHSVLSVLAVVLAFGHTIGVSNYLGLFWKALLWTGLILAALWLIIYVRFIKPWLLMRYPYEVEEVRPERGDVWTLALRPVNHAGFRFQPGQFSWLTLNITPFSMREHPFSMSSSGDRSDRLEFGIKALGDFTRRIKDVRPGTRAYLDGPYGVFTIDRYWDSAGFVLIVGGIGITPILSILVTAAQRQDDRPFLLIYANKSWDDIPYRETLTELQAQLDLEIVHVLRNPPDDWEGETGYVDQALLERYLPIHRGSRHYFICAAAKMMDQVEHALGNLDVPVTNIHLEHYNLA
ncbi:MAG: ferric reductase-like transmembrane domain-containing protein [Oculatellaceae cyanobacterium Prado106]|jgi:3-phenylpropionate/trans-cinnamate dioxygenase ferredoxin reductase subunit|nr:ferric reductase-like transmembrane domain-containing protein [Oculatellaceae cyanobacterium Prado106]